MDQTPLAAPKNAQALLDILAQLEDDETRLGFMATMPADALAKLFIQLRDAKSEVDAQTKKLTAPMTEGMNLIEQHFLAEMNQSGEKTKSGETWRATKSLDHNCRIPDPLAFYTWLQQSGRYDMLQKRLSKTVVKEYEEATGEIPPGVSVDPFYKVTFYKKT